MRRYYVVEPRPRGAGSSRRDPGAGPAVPTVVARRPIVSWARPLTDRALPGLVRRQGA